MLFLFDAYLPERYKNSIGSMRRLVLVRFGVRHINPNIYEIINQR